MPRTPREVSNTGDRSSVFQRIGRSSEDKGSSNGPWSPVPADPQAAPAESMARERAARPAGSAKPKPQRVQNLAPGAIEAPQDSQVERTVRKSVTSRLAPPVYLGPNAQAEKTHPTYWQ